jgi:hypothetical protein
MIVMSYERWDEAELTASRPSECAVHVIDPHTGQGVFAWSPYGEGAYYYDTLADLRAEHGYL